LKKVNCQTRISENIIENLNNKSEETMKKVLTIGGATEDVYLDYEGADCMKIMQSDGDKNFLLFESDAKIEVDKVLYFTGGGATNSAVSFKRLGFDVSCFCMTGDDKESKHILDVLKKEKVNTSNIATSKKYPSGRSFIINSLKRERTIFAFRGSNGFLQKKDLPLKSIKEADQLYITSLSYETSKILKDITTFAKKNKVPVAINPGKSQLSKGAKYLKESLKNIDTFILNYSEAKTFMWSLVSSNKCYKECMCPEEKEVTAKTTFLRTNFYFSIPNFLKEVLSMGPKIVVVTDGKNGVYVATKNQMFFHPSLKIKVVDTVGAGDSFGSCFVACLAKGLKIEDALRYGIVNSASVIENMGAKPGLLRFNELEKRTKKLGSKLLQKHRL